MSQQFGLVQSKGFQPAPEGKQPAILAEISWAMVEDRFEGKGPQLKMFWSFQLQAEDEQGERYVLDLELFPQISSKNKVGRFCKSWSGSKDVLSQDQLNQWRLSVMGNLVLKDKTGNPMMDEEGVILTKSFDTVEEFLAAVDPDPPLVGITAIVEVEHKESATTNRTYANITGIYINGKVDEIGNIIRDATTKRAVPAFEMDIEGYVSRADRQAEIQKRIAEKEAKKTGTPAAKPVTKAAKSAVPF